MHLAQIGDLASLIGHMMDIADFDNIAHSVLSTVQFGGNRIEIDRSRHL